MPRNASAKDESHKLAPGMCVLVTPDDTSFKPNAMLHKMLWRRARIVELIPGRDSRHRKVTIEWPDKNGKWLKTQYPIQKLCPVELTDKEKQDFFK